MMQVQEKPCKLTVDISPETMEARRQWNNIFNVLKGKKNTQKNHQQRILYPAKVTSKNKKEITRPKAKPEII